MEHEVITTFNCGRNPSLHTYLWIVSWIKIWICRQSSSPWFIWIWYRARSKKRVKHSTRNLTVTRRILVASKRTRARGLLFPGDLFSEPSTLCPSPACLQSFCLADSKLSMVYPSTIEGVFVGRIFLWALLFCQLTHVKGHLAILGCDG